MQLPPQLLTEKDGQALAASMLEEIQGVGEANMDIFAIDPEFRYGQPQNNILLDYIERVRTHGSKAALVGFASVLTDALVFPGTYAWSYREIAQEV
jgi:hypothetical protein